MKLAPLAASFALVVVTAAGCNHKADNDDSDGALGESESLLVADSSEAGDVEDDVEGGLEDPLSGADVTDPGAPADGADDDEVMGKVRKNPGLFFKPAGCITTSIAGNVATHVFSDCTGPYGLVHLSGTVVSTYVREPGKLTITHAATGFQINGATISGSRVVTYTRSGTVVTKTRTGNWSGTTAKGHPLEHTASFGSTYDASSKCVTRDGAATTTVGGRELDWSISGYKRCGIGSFGCPESGTITLSRTKGENTATVTIEFLGGRQYRVTGPRGGKVTGTLVCRAV